MRWYVTTMMGTRTVWQILAIPTHSQCPWAMCPASRDSDTNWPRNALLAYRNTCRCMESLWHRIYCRYAMMTPLILARKLLPSHSEMKNRIIWKKKEKIGNKFADQRFTVNNSHSFCAAENSLRYSISPVSTVNLSSVSCKIFSFASFTANSYIKWFIFGL